MSRHQITRRGARTFSAVILAGGRSLRMGRSKSALDFFGQTMLERVVARLSPRFADLIVVVAPRARPRLVRIGQGAARVTIVRDAAAYGGPLAAAARGLKAARNPVAFVCACDLPLVSTALALRLCRLCAGHLAAIPQVDGVAQPLHAAYSRSAAPTMAALAERGERRMTAMVGALCARVVREDELGLDSERLSFFNVNAPADYARALRLAREEAVSAAQRPVAPGRLRTPILAFPRN